MADTPVKAGLRGIVAGNSSISWVDGIEGRLIYRGYDIHDLAEHSTFEETAFLLWNGHLPTAAELEAFKAELKANRKLPEEVLNMIKAAPAGATPMEVLRTAVSFLALFDPDGDDMSTEAHKRQAVRLTGAFPTIVAAFDRIRRGEEPVEPSGDLDHAANFLYMVTGEVPDEATARIFDIVLVLHADHEFNASTFASRVTAATLSDIYSAITSAIGTLKGPLHGGANEQVLKMLEAIGTVEATEEWILGALERREIIMGFGHAVYKTMDPRAVHLKRMSKELGEATGDTRLYEMSALIQDIMHREKGLYPNVDFYTASVYDSLKITSDLFTPIFAISRISGWTAHVLEQYADNRLIRPRSNYTGAQSAEYVPIEERG